MLSDKISMKCIHHYTELGIKKINNKISDFQVTDRETLNSVNMMILFSVTDVRSCKKMTLTCLSA